MRRLLLTFYHLKLLGLIILTVPTGVSGQEFASAAFGQGSSEQAGQTSGKSYELKKVLKEVGKTHQINFIYANRNVEKRYVEKNYQKITNIDQFLTELLTPLGLEHKKLDNSNYIIKEAGENSAIPAKKVKKVRLKESFSRNSPSFLNKKYAAYQPTALQERTVSGRITDSEDGAPLPGVNILLKGTAIGTVSDINGNYSLTFNDEMGNILIFSSIGYASEEIQVGNRSVIDVRMVVDIQTLQEIVVIGYGQQEKKDLTGAVGSIDAKELENIPVSSFDQLLGGRAAGVQMTQNSGAPGGGVSLRIRGVSSINLTNEPLYVIDGVPVNSDATDEAEGFDWAGGGNGQSAVNILSTINPNDIESITVLKDASAQAIYGSRAAAGVIIVTTKRGKKGEAQFNYDGSYGIQQVTTTLDMMDLRQYADYQNEMADDGWIPLREEFMDPSLLGEGTDWQDEIFRTASIQNHQLSVTGGNEKTTYLVSGGYFNQEGTVIGSEFQRYSLRLNMDSEAKEWLKVGTSFNVSRTDERITLTDSEDGVITSAFRIAPSIPVRQLDGSYGGPENSTDNFTNPVAMALERDLELKRTRLIGNFYAEFNPIKHFSFRTELGGDYRTVNNYAFQPTYEWGQDVNEVSASLRSWSNNFFWVFKNYITYSNQFDKHNVTMVVGQEAQSSSWEGLSAGRRDFATNDIQEIGAGDPETATNNGWRGSNSMISYYSRLIYDFNDRYLLTGTIRADGSSNFGPNKRWGYFPSFSLGWKVHNEAFMSDITAISQLKIRAGYGETGNQNLDPYSYGSAINTIPTQFGVGYRPSNFPNDDLKWEPTRQTNLGFDISFLEDRFSLTVDVYRKITDALLLRKPLPDYVASDDIEAPFVNLGNIENEGIEVSLTTNNFRRSDLNWTSNFTFTRNVNKVTELSEDASLFFGVVQWTNTVTKTEVGQPLGQLYGYVVEGIFQNAADIESSPIQKDAEVGDIKFRNIDLTPDENGNQVIDDRDRAYIGNPYPDFTFGINNTVTYKNFDLNLYLRGSYGNEIFNFTRTSIEAMDSPTANQLASVAGRAKVEQIDPNLGDIPSNLRVANPEAIIPRMTLNDPNNNNRMSDRFVEDGSYLRIQNLSLGYTLPASLISKYPISRLRVYASVQNLYTFTDYSGLDPEIGAYNQDPLLVGVDNGRYPLPRTYTFGINLSF